MDDESKITDQDSQESESTPEIPVEEVSRGTTPVRIVKVTKDTQDPLGTRGFMFTVQGFVYRVYDVRNRGRRAIKLEGRLEND